MLPIATQPSAGRSDSGDMSEAEDDAEDVTEMGVKSSDSQFTL
jgi:hypothetical protein